MEASKKIQVFLQCNIATTSQMDWQPPVTSTPVPQVRQQSLSVFRERRIGMFGLKPAPALVKNSAIPSPVTKKINESILSKSKGKGILVCDSSSDEEEAYSSDKKKLIIKINADGNKEKDVKRTLKVKNVGLNVKKEGLKRSGRDLRSNKDLTNVSIRDKENLCENVDSEKVEKKRSKIPVKGKAPPRKRKSIKANPKGKKSKIDEEKPLEESQGNIDKSRNSISHQLFSETREQEFLESLDLTAVEVEEEPLNNNPVIDSTNQKKKEKKLKGKKNNDVKEKDVKNCSVASDRPVRSRKPPKKFWLPGEKLEGEVSSSVDKQDSIPKREKENGKKLQVEKEDVIENENENENMSVEYFKHIKDLKYQKNALGYQSAECCALPKFKSGILKIEKGGKAASMTKGKNSGLGGIVLEGSVRMKIADVEKDIHQGETIFVPPLTEWSAVNLTETESLIYYWCGLF